ATITPAQPLAGQTSQSLYCQASTVTVTLSVPGGAVRYVNVHLDYSLKGTTGYGSNASSTYVKGYNFIQTGTIPCETDLTAAGKDVTGVGGFAIKSNLVSKGGLTVNLCPTSGCGNQNVNRIKYSTTNTSDGFYFISYGAGSYMVELTTTDGTHLASSNNIS